MVGVVKERERERERESKANEYFGSKVSHDLTRSDVSVRL
jgi:hypothetical protein